MKTAGIVIVISFAVILVVGVIIHAALQPWQYHIEALCKGTRLEGDVYRSLSWDHQGLLDKFSCTLQRDILDDLADASNRDEAFDREMDAIDEMRKALKH